MPETLATDAALIERLQNAAKHEMTKEEIRQQQISFILGVLSKDSTVTRNQVEEILAKSEGLSNK